MHFKNLMYRQHKEHILIDLIQNLHTGKQEEIIKDVLNMQIN